MCRSDLSQHQPYQGLHGDRTNGDFVKPRKSLRKSVRRAQSGMKQLGWFALLLVSDLTTIHLVPVAILREMMELGKSITSFTDFQFWQN